MQEASELDRLKIDRLENEIKVLEINNKSYVDKVESLNNESSRLSEEINELEKSVSNQSEREITKVRCNYSGKAKIIAVVGSGSNGKSTIAMSIAKMLNKSNVLVMDLDLVNPKIDSWFNANPILGGINEIAEPIKRTASGALFELGADRACSMMNEIILSKTKMQGRILADFLWGVAILPSVLK